MRRSAVATLSPGGRRSTRVSVLSLAGALLACALFAAAVAPPGVAALARAGLGEYPTTISLGM
jgi:hypothetical protein